MPSALPMLAAMLVETAAHYDPDTVAHVNARASLASLGVGDAFLADLLAIHRAGGVEAVASHFPLSSSNRVERVSADGLTRVEFDFHVSCKGNTLAVDAHLCGALIFSRKSTRHKWRTPAHWADYNKAGCVPKPEVPTDVIDEARGRLALNLTVSS